MADVKAEIKKADPLIITLIEMYQEERYGYKVLFSSVFITVFYGLYNRLIQADVQPIELLSSDLKSKYWNIAKQYNTDKDTAIKISKVAYILTLISEHS